MNHYHVGGRKFDCIPKWSSLPFSPKCRSQQYMSTGSHQVTKAVHKHIQKDRRLSVCFKNKVLRRPIFSIGQYLRLVIPESEYDKINGTIH